MRLAIAGKGGTGKTTISATLARLVARDGSDVVTIDADSNPNLSAALGLDHEALVGALPTTIVSRRLHGPGLNRPLDEVLDAHTVLAPDGVRVALMGMPQHAEEGCLCSAHATVSAVLDDLGQRDRTVTIVDLEASPEHLSRGTTRHVDALLLVTEPYYRSLETVRRMAGLASELPIALVGVVANKVRSPMEEEAVRDFCDRHGLQLLATIPFSDAVVDADVAGQPIIDRAPDDPAVRAVADLATRLLSVPAGQATRVAKR